MVSPNCKDQQLLIRVSIRNSAGQKETTMYRVPAESRFCDVLRIAVDRSEMPGNPYCAGVSPLGVLEPHLHQYYPALLSERCATDGE